MTNDVMPRGWTVPAIWEADFNEPRCQCGSAALTDAHLRRHAAKRWEWHIRTIDMDPTMRRFMLGSDGQVTPAGERAPAKAPWAT